ncbi:MAG: DUF2970 domain-containing protein [Gammaproteobacteria bacterium]
MEIHLKQRFPLVTQEPANNQTGPKKIPFYKVLLSVIQASIGVQNSKNRERDFTQGKFWPFVVAALLVTAAFVLTVATVVKMVLAK